MCIICIPKKLCASCCLESSFSTGYLPNPCFQPYYLLNVSLYFQIKPFCQKKSIGENDQQLLKRDAMCIRNHPAAPFFG